MAEASTSEARAMPTAIYGSTSKNVTNIGVMTAAALIPAKPVPRPAPIPAKKVTRIVIKNFIQPTFTCYPFRVFSALSGIPDFLHNL